MKHRFLRIRTVLFTACSIIIVAASVICHFAVPSVISVYVGSDAYEAVSAPFTIDGPNFDAEAAEAMAYKEIVSSYTAEAYVLGFLPLKTVAVNVYDRIYLCPGGMTVGVRMDTEGVIVTGITELTTRGGTFSPAYSAGIRVHDVITAVNGSAVTDAADIIEAVEGCAGGMVTFTLTRDGTEMTLSVSPIKSQSDGLYKAGFTLKDGATGLGTVTFINPDDGSFAALGHGITDSSMILPFSSGTVGGVVINDIKRGKATEPGEISGSFSSDKFGVLIANTRTGIFGYFNEIPAEAHEALPIALKDEIKDGAATVLSTDGSGGVAEYDIKISSIDRSGASDTKNFIVEVTDPELLALTGGIIQGMSGSPLLQDGHIIGALTHVMVNDPHKGYGIFIENMIKEMEKQPVTKASE